MPGNDLKKLYCSLVCSVLKYTSVMYYSMLTKKQENNLEIVQKKCLVCIYDYHKSHSNLLTESGLQPLITSREAAFLRLARKSAQNPINAHWFKENQNPTSQRCLLIYGESLLEPRVYITVLSLLCEES